MAGDFYRGEKVKIKDHQKSAYRGKTGVIVTKGAQAVPGRQLWLVSIEPTKEPVLCSEEQLELVLPW